ncbi:MAG TPA: signal recognition particle protein [Acidobacteriota bacterium]|nr:signal recognition particle protein [Acidobacteriota bacterium]
MFESLSDKLQKVLRDLKGEGRVSEKHIDESMRQIRIALLEADVNFKVVKDFVARVREKALGQEVLKSLTPGQQVVKIVRDELVELLGGEAVPIQHAKVPPTVIIMVGLQGSGKTTTTGKLALWLRRNGHRPLMVSTDVYRPAAIEQLSVIGRAVDIPVFNLDGLNDALERARRALVQARNTGYDVLLIDTAGRLHIDENLMVELERMQEMLTPKEVLLVADAMTGQDAVNSAGQFDKRLALTGVILTKMDGDARGGAALSIKAVTGKPIKFVGVGEKYDALEMFHPDRLAGRILGMGDVLSLIEKAEEAVDEEDAERMLEKLRRDQFTLEDFRDQLRQIRRLGPLEQILGMLPQFGPFKGMNKLKIDEKELAHVEAIINSMTPRERVNYKIIDGSRRKRIAKGSGRPVSEVNRLLKQYIQARKMMKQMGKGLMGKRLPKLNFPI